MDVLTELAKMFKERDNENNGYDNFIIGTIISPTPNPVIQIESNVIAERDDLIFVSAATYERGEKVALIPTKNNEIFLVIGKAVQY